MIYVPAVRKFCGSRKPVWVDIAAGFPEDRECLAAFIAFEAAEVLQGVKPSNLVNLVNRPRRCGKNLYDIWKEHGEGILRRSSLEAKIMAERPGSLLVLIFNRHAVCRLLENKGVHALLRKSGYASTYDADDLLTEVSCRFACGGIPHEIGIVLGYPLKDVTGFMGLGRLAFTCQGPWRIYGNPLESLRLAEMHRECRCRMVRRLKAGRCPFECLDISQRFSGREKAD